MYIIFIDSVKNWFVVLWLNLEGWLYLYYDIEGCFCENSGIFILWLVEEKIVEDDEIELNIGLVLIKWWIEMFLEEVLIIDYNDIEKIMILKSDG